MGEEGASLSSGSLRLYAIPNSSLLIPNLMQGWTDNYIRVARPYDPSLVNTVEDITLSEENIIRETL